MEQLQYRDIVVNVYRKSIKNAYLRVDQETGEIKMTAPLYMLANEIKQFVTNSYPKLIHQLDKAKIHMKKLEQEHFLFQNRKVNFKYEPFKSNAYHLFEDTIVIKFNNEQMIPHIREKAFQEWQKLKLYKLTKPLMDKWANRIGVTYSELGISTMKSRWGVCNTQTKQIRLSLMLSNKPMACIEYVIVHELVHLLEASHNHIFKALMTKYLPNWEFIKAKLNQA